MAKFRDTADSDTKNIFENGILSRNPVLVYAIGICPLIAVAKSAATASVLAVLSAILLIVSEVLTALFIKKMPKWLRVGVYALLGVLIIIPFYLLMGIYMPSIEVSLGIYIPLLAVNSLTVQRCEACAVKHSVKLSFLDAVANSIGYAIPLILTGIIREALGSSRIFGYYIDALPQANGFLMPFCGFIILGFVAAFINFVRNKFRIGEEFDAKENDFVLDKKKDIAIYDSEDEDSMQNEITVVPETVSEAALASHAVQETVKEPVPEEEPSASFESSVSRIMHKWSPTDDTEISEETAAKANSDIDKDDQQQTAAESVKVSASDTETPVNVSWQILPTDTSAAKSVKEAAAETADSPKADTNTAAAQPAAAEASEAAEAPAPKKTTRKRTTKKTAAEAENTEAPAPKKTTRKRTTKKTAETAAETVDSAKADTATAAAQPAAEGAAKAAEAPAPKKTTRKRTTKKTAETAAETADSANANTNTAAAQPAAEGAAEAAEAPAPKKTTRKRTTEKTAETAAETAGSTKADTNTAAAQPAAAAENTEAPAPKKTTRKRTTKKAAEAAAETADSAKADTNTSAAQSEAVAEATESAEAPAPKKPARKKTASKSAEKAGQAHDTPKED